MAYWLFKSEPGVYAWGDLVQDGLTRWDGVRNHVAKANLMAMKVGDLGFFYHSNEGKEIVGVVEVVGAAEPDVTVKPDKLSADGSNPWVVVTLRPLTPLACPVSLAAVKAEPRLAAMALVTQQRLSVQPVAQGEWEVVMGMAGVS